MKEINIENILETIKSIRQAENASQAEIAQRIGTSVSFYGMIERGNRTLSVDLLIKIAQAFDCSLTDFLELVESQE